jgi:hypothetical protein
LLHAVSIDQSFVFEAWVRVTKLFLGVAITAAVIRSLYSRSAQSGHSPPVRRQDFGEMLAASFDLEPQEPKPHLPCQRRPNVRDRRSLCKLLDGHSRAPASGFAVVLQTFLKRLNSNPCSCAKIGAFSRRTYVCTIQPFPCPCPSDRRSPQFMKMVADHANSFLARHELIVTAKLPTSTHFNAQPEGSISGGNSGTECGCLKGYLNSPLNRQDRAIHRPSSCASHWRKRLLAAGKRVTNYYLTAWPIAHFVQKKS